MNNSRSAARWWIVAGYAVAMAWVEAAVVYYLRTMLDRIEPHQPNPLPMLGGLGPAELVREAATLIMLLAVGILAGQRWRERLGFAAIAFGIWDIFYYVFLKVLCGWPHSVFDWDVLFLLPLPWWGPVLAPVLISVLMILWGTLAVGACQSETMHRGEAGAWLVSFCGMGLALYISMADTLHAAPQGVQAVHNVLPVYFAWPRFCLALLLMSAPAILALRRFLLRPHAPAVVVTGRLVGGCNPLLGTLTQSNLSEAGSIRSVDQC